MKVNTAGQIKTSLDWSVDSRVYSNSCHLTINHIDKWLGGSRSFEYGGHEFFVVVRGRPCRRREARRA